MSYGKLGVNPSANGVNEDSGGRVMIGNIGMGRG